MLFYDSTNGKGMEREQKKAEKEWKGSGKGTEREWKGDFEHPTVLNI